MNDFEAMKAFVGFGPDDEANLARVRSALQPSITALIEEFYVRVLSFPVTSGNSLNWDFVVVAHEIGHNMSSPHTHDYCPPIDECFQGVCSSGGNCVPGTIMSYCHLCGGMANVQTHFASRVSQRMRNKINGSCLQDFDCTGAAMCPTVR